MYKEGLRRLIAGIRRISPDTLVLTADTDLLDDLGMDSLEITELIFGIEDEMDIQIDFEAFNPQYLRNFGQLCDFLEGKYGADE